MKKVFLTLALAAFAFAANAQFVVSGDLGFNHNGLKNTLDGKEYWTGTTNKATDFGIALKAGYQLTDQIQAGVMIGFAITNTKAEADPTNTGSVTSTTKINTHDFAFGVYGRYDFLQFNKLSVFAEGQLAIGMGGGKTEVETAGAPTVSTDAPKTFSLGLNVVPGVSYKLTDRLSAELYFDFIGLGFNMGKTTTKVTDATGKEVDDVTTNTSFGLNATTDRDNITALWNTVRMGVTFHF